MEGKAGVVIERAIKAAPEKVWAMWTTKKGLGQWWGPEGFVSQVRHLDVRVGGHFEILMRAVGPDQVAFLNSANLPLENSARGTYTGIFPSRRLAFNTLVDFVPGVAPFDVENSVELTAEQGGTVLRFCSAALHDREWTQRSEMGWAQQLDKLGAMVSSTPD